MVSLRTILLLVPLAVTGAATGASSEDPPAGRPTPPPASTPPAAPPRAEPPASPRKYLEAGATLFNTGRFELAGKYLRAAEMYRERLTPSERVVLEVYREKLDHYLRSQAGGVAQARQEVGGRVST